MIPVRLLFRIQRQIDPAAHAVLHSSPSVAKHRGEEATTMRRRHKVLRRFGARHCSIFLLSEQMRSSGLRRRRGARGLLRRCACADEFAAHHRLHVHGRACPYGSTRVRSLTVHSGLQARGRAGRAGRMLKLASPPKAVSISDAAWTRPATSAGTVQRSVAAGISTRCWTSRAISPSGEIIEHAHHRELDLARGPDHDRRSGAAPVAITNQARAPGTGCQTSGTAPEAPALFEVSAIGARKSWPAARAKLISGV